MLLQCVFECALVIRMSMMRNIWSVNVVHVLILCVDLQCNKHAARQSIADTTAQFSSEDTQTHAENASAFRHNTAHTTTSFDDKVERVFVKR